MRIKKIDFLGLQHHTVTDFNTQIGTDIRYAAALLEQGSIVGMPTETVYGLSGSALSEDAVLRIFRAKNRPFFDPLIVHTHSISEISKYVDSIPDALLPLMQRFMPGPLTVLLPRRAVIPDLVTSGLDRVACRIPAHPLAIELLRSVPFPLAAPSANPFGYISPTTAAHVLAQLGGVIPYILDGGECQVGIESTIIGMEGDAIVIYRPGGLALEQIESVAGSVRVLSHSSSHPAAPGLLLSHYAPRKPLLLGNIQKLIAHHHNKKIAILSFSDAYRGYINIILAANGNMELAAKRLFAAMRELDQTDADIILAEQLPNQGLGLAINDRLIRASVKA